MISISLCMIVRNEEEALERCLSSVQGIADEIIIVDTGSTDRTKDIAAQFSCRIFDFEWIDHFAAARNYAFAQATKDYIMWLDADDVIEEEDRSKLLKLKSSLPEGIDRITMAYNLAFDNAGGVVSSLRRNRIVRRVCGFQWVGPVHEYLAAAGMEYPSDAAVTHKKNKVYTDRNLRIYLKRKEDGEDFSPRDLYYFANELKDHSRNEEAIEYYDRFLKGGQGWIEDNIQACMKMGECYSRMGDNNGAIQAWSRSLIYDKPRPEYCCAMGGHFFEQHLYDKAVFWYDAATRYEEAAHNMGFVNLSTSTWFPHLQLCLCFDRLGQYERANEHNEKALALHPTHPSLLFNRNYFQDRLGSGS